MDQTFLQIVVFINCEPHRNCADVVPCYFVFFDEGFFGAAAVLGGGGGREVPFYVGCSADEGDVVEIDYLGALSTSDSGR